MIIKAKLFGQISICCCWQKKFLIYIKISLNNYNVDYFCIDTFSSFIDKDINHEVEIRNKNKKNLLAFKYNDYSKWKKNFQEYKFIKPIKCGCSTFDFSSIAPINLCFLDVDLYLPTINTLNNIWDFMAEDYKPRWCVVRQKMMQEGEPAYFEATLNEYSTLVTRIRRQFEMMVPEMFRKERKLIDGEDIDIDDVIENMVDIKTGVSPDEKFYWRRNKVQREVAVAFLLDISASTAEAIDEGKNKQDDWDAPDDPVEYMVWLRTRRGEQMRRSYKRIIDMEKESMVLLINALEAIGDTYGIYGFSGYGRENVEFYTVKDLHENFSDKVKRRIDRIAPMHATRMGPAIRHATYKLDNTDARTKILFLISDGRPQDRGYSREGVEKEYAVHDTKKALDEAKIQGINSFCLTVDKNGHDYLKTMCSDMGYEILDDINDLPERLLVLYRRLTM